MTYEADSDDRRFAFGENWKRFLADLTDERVADAERSLKTMLSTESLENRTVLDVGSGSGLFSLAACRLGAKVHSFDFDEDSVACTAALKQAFRKDDSRWTIDHGSILDRDFVAALGTYDIVYAWGVLHHTGALWDAIAAAASRVKPRGLLFISVYNDQGRKSAFWKAVKARYNRMPPLGKRVMIVAAAAHFYGRPALLRTVRGRRPFRNENKPERGMSKWHDLVDWVGGYPFEVARPEEVFEFCHRLGFELRRLKTVGGGLGCNEFVFSRPN